METTTLGLPEGEVLLLPHHEGWSGIFETEAQALRHAINDDRVEILHIGSTSIPGIRAKPIIDLLIGIPDGGIIPHLVETMTGQNYHYKGENGIPGRHFLTKGNPRTFHAHAVPIGGEIYSNHLKFKRILRQEPALAEQYDRLKGRLATQYPKDRKAYTEGKNEFITKILNIKIT